MGKSPTPKQTNKPHKPSPLMVRLDEESKELLALAAFLGWAGRE